MEEKVKIRGGGRDGGGSGGDAGVYIHRAYTVLSAVIAV